MELITPPTHQQVRRFRDTLWKDLRVIRMEEVDGVLALSKSAMAPGEAQLEAKVIRALHETGLPTATVIHSADDGITLSYIKGSRLFNVFVELDMLPGYLDGPARAAKKLLLERAANSERQIQALLYSISDDLATGVYPFEKKTADVLMLVADILDLGFSHQTLARELTTIETQWQDLVCTPFRDATSKNMVLADERLWLHSFADEVERRAFILNSFVEAAPNLPDWLGAPIVPFDFGSCNDLTTPEDDQISLLAHERTYTPGVLNQIAEETWLPQVPGDRYRTAATLIVRYGRFGGRKAAYQLVHPAAFITRFRYDNAAFYFRELQRDVLDLAPELADCCPLLLELCNRISERMSATVPAVDYFREYENPEKRRYYVDLFPD